MKLKPVQVRIIFPRFWTWLQIPSNLTLAELAYSGFRFKWNPATRSLENHPPEIITL